MTPQPILIVFLKYPRSGKVKTRLAASIGGNAAAQLYRQWIGIVLRNVQPVRANIRVVGYYDGAAADEFAEWAAFVDEWLPQPAGDLGARLAHAFDWGHKHGGPVLAIGTDCLELDATHIREALARLQNVDIVFGPATDGGYYLVGMHEHLPQVFDQIRWSSPNTLDDSIARCNELAVRTAHLLLLADIDTLADWHAYQRRRGEST